MEVKLMPGDKVRWQGKVYTFVKKRTQHVGWIIKDKDVEHFLEPWQKLEKIK